MLLEHIVDFKSRDGASRAICVQVLREFYIASSTTYWVSSTTWYPSISGPVITAWTGSFWKDLVVITHASNALA